MKNKIVGILVCIMLVMSTIVVIIPNGLKVKAEGGGSGDNREVGLDFQYIWNITDNLSKVIFSYPSNMIPKGRAFGTWGERWAADHIIQDEMIEIGLWNVTLEQLENIPSGFDQHLPTINFTEKLEVLSKGITVYDEVNGTNTTITDCHIRPMWNWRFLWAVILSFPTPAKGKEFLEDVFGINLSVMTNFDRIFESSMLTKNVSFEHCKLVRRPTNLSWYFDLLFNKTQEIMNNESIVDYSTFMRYFLPEFQEYHNFTFGELNSSNAAEELFWFEQWKSATIGDDEGFLYIGEEQD